MKKEIRIPSIGESVREVTIGRFLKQNSEFVSENEEILELETEKVNQVIFSPATGILSWSVSEGDTAIIDQVIGYVDTEAKESPKSVKEEKKISPPPKSKEEILPQKKEEIKKVEKRAVTGKKESRQKMTRLRQVISKRLVDSLHNTAMLTTFNEVDMSTIMKLRSEKKELFFQKHKIKLGMTSFFVKATLEALKAYPLLNSYIDGDEIVYREYFDIGVAVSTDKGLVVPIIRDCDGLDFIQIEKLIEEYALKAREGKLRLEDLEGGGFTISNGGVFGSLLSTPILNPPQVGILGMHKIEKRAVVIDDQITIRPMMYLALSYDHRIIDGKEAIQFLNKIKEELETFSIVV